MARSQITYGEFNLILQDLERMNRQSPALRFLLKEKINRFHQLNSMSIKILNKFIIDNVKKYVEHENDLPVIKEIDGATQYCFASPDDEKAYLDEANEFMNRSIYVEG
jgi:hypothetical protein